MREPLLEIVTTSQCGLADPHGVPATAWTTMEIGGRFTSAGELFRPAQWLPRSRIDSFMLDQAWSVYVLFPLGGLLTSALFAAMAFVT